MQDNPYSRELVDFRHTLQEWLRGATPVAHEEKTFARRLAVVPEENVYVRADRVLLHDPMLLIEFEAHTASFRTPA